MKLRLPMGLLAAVLASFSFVSKADVMPPDSVPPLVEDFVSLSYLLDRDYSYSNPSFFTSSGTGASLAFDGAGLYSLSFERNDEVPRYMIHLENMTSSADGVSLAFERLTGVSFINSQEGAQRTKGSIYLYAAKGDSSLLFSDISGDLYWSGFVAWETGTVLVRSDSGDAAARFHNVAGDITFINNRGNEQNLTSPGICVWTDSRDGFAQLDFSLVTGNILFSANVNNSLGAALCVFGFEGKSSINFSDIAGNITFMGNTSYYGGSIYTGGMGDGTDRDAHVVFSRIAGDLRFSGNEAASGGAMVISGGRMDVIFSDITGDVVFENNKARSGWEPAVGGGIVLDISGSAGDTEAATLEFSHIEGDLIFRNNQAGTVPGEEAYGGAIMVMGGSGAHLILSADKGDILFDGNRAAFTANAVYLATDSVVDVIAGCEYAVYFYDPVVTDAGAVSMLNINNPEWAGEGEDLCGGTVIFSGGRITEESLGGDAGDLEERMDLSMKSVVNGTVAVYQGKLVVADSASLSAFSYDIKETASVETSNGGHLDVTGEQGTISLESGAQFDASVIFSRGIGVLELEEGSSGKSTDIRGSFSGLQDIAVNGGTFFRYSGFGEIENLELLGGRLDLGRTETGVLRDEGGTLNLVLSGPGDSLSPVLSADSVTGTFASSWMGGAGKEAGFQVLFDLTASGQDLAGSIYPLFSWDGVLQQYGSVWVAGVLSGAGEEWHTYESGNILFQYRFDGSSIVISDRIQEIIGSTPDPQPGTGGVKVEIIRELEKGVLSADPGNPLRLEFSVGEEAGTEIGRGVLAEGNLTASRDIVSERSTLIHPDGSREILETVVLRPGGINLTATENVTLIGVDPDCGAVKNVDTLSIKPGIAFRLQETSMDIGRTLEMKEGSSLIAVGQCSRVSIGGAVMESSGSLPELTSSSLASSIIAGAALSFSEGASLTVVPLGISDGSSLNSRMTVSDSSVELGRRGDSLGGFLRAETGAELIFSHSRIRGTGSVENAVISGGSLTAGAPTGVLSIGGVTLNGGTELKVQLSANIESARLNTNPEAFSLFSVTGAVHIGNARFAMDWDSSALGNSALLSAGTGFRVFVLENESAWLDGHFSALDLPGLSDGLVWDTSQLYSQGILTVVNARLGNGTRMANALWSSAGTVGAFAGTVMSHLNDWRETGNHFWVSGLGDFSSYGNHGGRQGFDYRGGGYAIGGDGRLGNSVILGLAFGQTFGTHDPSFGDARYSPGSIKQDGIMAAVYGRLEMERSQTGLFYLDGYFSYGSVTNKSEKGALYDGDTARAKWDDNVFQAGLKAVWEMALMENTFLKPFIAMDYVHAGQDDFTESTSAASARYRDGRYQNWILTAGAEISRRCDMGGGMFLTPGITLAYKADVARDVPSVYAADAGGDYVRALAVAPGRNGLYAAFDLRWQISGSWMASAGYELEARSGETGQSVNASVSYAF